MTVFVLVDILADGFYPAGVAPGEVEHGLDAFGVLGNLDLPVGAALGAPFVDGGHDGDRGSVSGRGVAVVCGIHRRRMLLEIVSRGKCCPVTSCPRESRCLTARKAQEQAVDNQP